MQDRVAERAFYDRLFLENPENEHITTGYEEVHQLAFVHRPDGRVLDLGCGTGTHTLRMVRRGFRVVAVDLSLAAVLAARRRLRTEGLPGSYVVADAENLPFRQEAFEVIWSALLLHHFPRLDRLPAELWRVTRNRVIAFEPNAQNLLTWIAFNVVNRWIGLSSTTRNQRALWPGRLSRVFERHGFRAGRIHYIHRPWVDRHGWLARIRATYEATAARLPLSLRSNKFLVSFQKVNPA